MDGFRLARAPTPRDLASTEEHREDEQEQQHRQLERLSQPIERRSEVGNRDPLATPDAARRHDLGVVLRAVVAAERVFPVLDRNDSMEHVRVEQSAVVEDRVADRVPTLLARDHEVARMQAGLHARAVDHGVGGPAAELDGPEKEHRGGQGCKPQR